MPGKLTPEELLLDESFIDYCLNNHSEYKAKWEQLSAADPEMAIVINDAKELLSVLTPQLTAGEVNAEVGKFRELFTSQLSNNLEVVEAALNEEQVREDARRKSARTRRNWFAGTAIAAGILFAITLIMPKPADKPTALTIIEHTTGFGERLQIALPDGSTVILNSNSTLRYKSDFNQKDRRLELSGEAYFDVASNPGKKFTVHTDRFSSTAIGTAFYIYGRQPAHSYAVDLLEGKLNVENTSGGSLLLAPGEQADWPNGQNAFSKNRFDTASLRRWINGRLQFDRAAMKEVLPQLAKWYAVEIEDQRSKPGSISITGDYNNKPLEDILKAICYSLSCKYTISGNKIIIQ